MNKQIFYGIVFLFYVVIISIITIVDIQILHESVKMNRSNSIIINDDITKVNFIEDIINDSIHFPIGYG